MQGRRNEYGWNKTLRFSWGHIIAFVALVLVCYVIFMGVVYWCGGDFLVAGAVAGASLVALLVTSIGAQLCKATERRFDRFIGIERILVCLYPIVFIVTMVPYNQFWGVVSVREDIEGKFSSSLSSSKQFFDRYDSYADGRIKMYEDRLSNLDKARRENYVLTLKLQLKSVNYENLKAGAIKWIDERSQIVDIWYARLMGNGTSIWNVFLLGNIDKIDSAIDSWNKTLVGYSSPVLSNEGSVGNFGEGEDIAGRIREDLNSIQKMYRYSYGLKFNTFWTAILLFFALLLPYMLQSRNTKARGFYHLVPFVIKLNSKRGERDFNDSPNDGFDDSHDVPSDEYGEGIDDVEMDGGNECAGEERVNNDSGKGLFEGTF